MSRQLSLQGSEFLGGSARNRFDVHCSGFTSLLQVACDRRSGHTKQLDALSALISLIDCSKHPFSHIVRIGFHLLPPFGVCLLHLSPFILSLGSRFLPAAVYEYVSSAPFPPYTKVGTNAQPDFGTFPPPYAKEAVRPNAAGKKVLNIVIATIIFCIGNFVASLGLIGGLSAFMNDSLAVLIGFCLLFASFIVFAIVITLHKVFFLRWWLKILLAFAAIGIGLIALAALTILIEGNHTLSNAMYAAGVVFYSIIVEVIALC